MKNRRLLAILTSIAIICTSIYMPVFADVSDNAAIQDIVEEDDGTDTDVTEENDNETVVSEENLKLTDDTEDDTQESNSNETIEDANMDANTVSVNSDCEDSVSSDSVSDDDISAEGDEYLKYTLTYSVNNDEAIVTGYTGFANGDLIIPSILGGYPVTRIGMSAFNRTDCTNFTGRLIIGDSVKIIGDSAFSGCDNLTGSLTIPDSVTEIGDYAFHNCPGFDGTLTIGNNVTSIGNSAFYGCSGFTGDLTIPDSVTSIEFYAFAGCSGFSGDLVISNSVTQIEGYAFSGCSGLTGDLTIPNSVNTIKFFAFEGCSGFTGNLEIPNSVTEIERQAFLGCSGFTGDLTIPNSVTTIGAQAFSGCTGLGDDLTIPSSVTSVGAEAFQKCAGIKKIINNSDVDFDLSRVAGGSHYWKDSQTDNRITSIKKGTAIRVDYPYEEVEFDIKINYVGRPYCRLQLTDVDGNLIKNSRVSYCIRDYSDDPGGEGINPYSELLGNVMTDSKGYATIEGYNEDNEEGKFIYNSLNDSQNKKTIVAHIYYRENNKFYKTLQNAKMKITVEPLSFDQSWSLGSKKEVEASIGPSVGVEFVVAKAEAGVEAAITGEAGNSIDIEAHYENGKRDVKLTNTLTKGVGAGVGGKVGAKIGMDNDSADINVAEINAVGINGNAKVKSIDKLTLKITDFDKNDPADRLKVGKFLLLTDAINTADAFRLNAFNALKAVDIYDEYEEGFAYNQKGNATVGEVKFGKFGIGTIASGEHDFTYTYNAKKGAGGTTEKSIARSSVINEKVFSSDFKENNALDTNNVDKYTLTNAGTSLSLSSTIGYDTKTTGFAGYKNEIVEDKVKLECAGDTKSGLVTKNANLKQFTSGNKPMIFKNDFKGIVADVNASKGVFDYTRTKEESIVKEIPLRIGIKAGAGVKVGLDLYGIESTTYETEIGKKDNGIFSQYSKNYIEENVFNNALNVSSIISDSCTAVGNAVKGVMNTVSGAASSLVQNASAKVKAIGNAVSGRIASITAVVSQGDRQGSMCMYVPVDNGYDEEIPALGAIGDVLPKETVVTVGQAYWITMTESDGVTEVLNFSDTPLELTLEYTDEMLSSSGASSEDEKKLEIYKYQEDSYTYISVGGTVDLENNAVITEITEPGEYVLALGVDKETLTPPTTPATPAQPAPQIPSMKMKLKKSKTVKAKGVPKKQYKKIKWTTSN